MLIIFTCMLQLKHSKENGEDFKNKKNELNHHSFYFRYLLFFLNKVRYFLSKPYKSTYILIRIADNCGSSHINQSIRAAMGNL